MNVLLTCAGRRSSEIAGFKDAVGGGGRVLACYVERNMPGLPVADKGFLVPQIDVHDYVDALLGLVPNMRSE